MSFCVVNRTKLFYSVYKKDFNERIVNVGREWTIIIFFNNNHLVLTSNDSKLLLLRRTK